MASLTLTVGTFTRTRTVSAGDTTRVLNALKTYFGNPNMTNQAAFDALEANVLQQLKGIVKSVEGDAARAAVVDIIAT